MSIVEKSLPHLGNIISELGYCFNMSLAFVLNSKS